MTTSHRTTLVALSVVAVILALSVSSNAQRTVGLMKNDNRQSFNGYTLFAPIGSTITYLIDNCGNEVHRWKSDYVPGLSVYLLDDGSILRAGQYPNPIFMSAGGYGGIVERIAWDGTLLWSYKVSTDSICQHHDAFPMPNGNVMIIAWDRRSRDEALAKGRQNLTARDVLSEKLIEVKPDGLHGGDVVWEWRLWDHLVEDAVGPLKNYGHVSDHPELLDINVGAIPPGLPDWIHVNSVDYNEERDELILSSHNLSELWIIDHSTTTEEAAEHSGGKSGHGGDFLFRWGNPIMYKSGTKDDQKLGAQHNAQWIRKGLNDAGSIMVFNNLATSTGDTISYSSVDIITPVIRDDGHYKMDAKRFLPDAADWRYEGIPKTAFYAFFISGCQRLANGNTLICTGPSGDFFEVNPAKETVWRYINPASTNGPLKQGATPTGNMVFRCTRYAMDHPAFHDKTLVAGAPIELNPLPTDCTLIADVQSESGASSLELSLADIVHAGSILTLENPLDGVLGVRIVDLQGRVLSWCPTLNVVEKTQSLTIPELYSSGMYLIELHSATSCLTRKFMYLGSH